MNNILILSATASAINYLFSLGNDENYKLFITDAGQFASGLYDHRIKPIRVPRAREKEKYKNALEEIISQYNIDVLIPTSDHDMEGVARLLKEGWNPKVKMFKFNPDNFELYTNKLKLSRELLKLGVNSIKEYSEAEEMAFPVVVKPTREGGSKGVWIVNNKSELDKKLLLIKKQFGDEVIIQEYIPGDTGSIFVVLLLFDQNGKLCGEVVTQSTLTFMTWGGGGNAGHIVENQELLEDAKSILEKLGGWKGPINMEFKRHAKTGKYYLMEINCRLNGYSYLNSMNGLNFPKGVIELLDKGETPFISSKELREKKNFILSYREKVVSEWIN